jgi:hypothetical protein
MSVGVGWRRGLIRCVAVLPAAAVLLLGSGTAAAQCEIDAGGSAFDLRDARTPSRAVRLRTDDIVRLERPDDGLLGVLVWFGPAPIPVPSIGDEGGAVVVDLSEISWLAVGLYRIEVFGPGAGECSGTFWIRVEGRSAFTTVAGVSSIVIALLGVALVASSVRRGHRRRCSLVRGSLGGLLTGIGAGALAQQLLFVPMLVFVVVAALVIPTVAGAFIARAACVPVPGALTLTPLLAAPLVVRADEPFEVHVGVGLDNPQSKRRPATHDVTVQLVCAGAAVLPGESWRRRLAVRADRHRAEAVVQMRAVRDIGESHLTVFYASGGQTVGLARRPLWVVQPSDPLPPPIPAGAGTVAAPFTVPVEQPPVDLELRASFAGPRALNVLHWTIETPHSDRITVPDEPIAVDLGGAPEAFAAELLLDVSENEGRPGLDELLLGAGRQLARTVDPRVIGIVREVLATVPRARVLLLSEESSVPWELMAIEPTATGEPPFLATRAVVGRWFLHPGTPQLPPPIGVQPGRRSVIATDVLPAAQLEAHRLQSELGFRTAAPTVAGVLDALEQSETVHLACHGSWRLDQGRCVLELADGRVVPKHIAGLRLTHHPFVFLNACQVASGGEALGTPTGFPAELVFAGASGCVTPLWSVRDDEACELGIAFYREALAGRPAAEVIREQRWRAMTDGLSTSTPFAYQFVGHPDLRLADGAVADAPHAA